MEKYFKIILASLLFVICILLGTNTFFLYTIINRMPPTISELKNANEEDRKQLILKKPAVSIDLPYPLEVEVSNTPLDVNIDNTPIEVEFYR